MLVNKHFTKLNFLGAISNVFMPKTSLFNVSFVFGVLDKGFTCNDIIGENMAKV